MWTPLGGLHGCGVLRRQSPLFIATNSASRRLYTDVIKSAAFERSRGKHGERERWWTFGAKKHDLLLCCVFL